MNQSDLKIVALAGGVGGARFADGLAQVLQPHQLTIIVNTGDDFTHLSLQISPDLDTVCYTLAGLANPETGWGRINETWNVFEALKKNGMPDWFRLGDSDLVTHLYRTMRLGQGCSLSQVTQELCRLWGVEVKVLPMSDDPVQTSVITAEGEMQFQEYFVHRQSEPRVMGFTFDGAGEAKPAGGVLDAIRHCDAIALCPSNPWVSIDPILSVPGIKEAIKAHFIIAISPIIGNKAVKGPAAKMFSELGIAPSALAVAQHYRDLINNIIIDRTDEDLIGDITKLGIQPYATDILMHDQSDRGRLAVELMDIIKASIRG